LFGHKIDLLGISIGMELGSDQNCFGTIKVNLKTNILFVSIYTFENIRSILLRKVWRYPRTDNTIAKRKTKRKGQ
jgi:hypothetical protein